MSAGRRRLELADARKPEIERAQRNSQRHGRRKEHLQGISGTHSCVGRDVTGWRHADQLNVHLVGSQKSRDGLRHRRSGQCRDSPRRVCEVNGNEVATCGGT